MAANWRTVRVFISSTFQDMHAERDHLVRVVFPELKEQCRKIKVHLIELDLRWGVSEQDAQDGKALDICLDEIDSSRPYFIGILGHRYGWIPPGQTRSITAEEIRHGVLHGHVPRQVVDLPTIIEERMENKTISEEQKRCLVNGYRWNAEKGKYVLQDPISAEEKKIIASVFQQYSAYQRDRSYFFFRSESLTRQLASGNWDGFFEKKRELQENLSALKEEIRAEGLPVFDYHTIEQFGQKVRDILWERIEKEAAILPGQTKTWLEEESELHELFMADRSRRFVGRHQTLNRLHEFCERENGPQMMMVSGEPGCGKSALLARFTEEVTRKNPGWLIIPHFVGASPDSTNLRQTLLRICLIIQKHISEPVAIPDSLKDLVKTFPELLEKIPKSHRVIIVLDAVNQFEKTDNALSLLWLPRQLPPHIRILVSTLPQESDEDPIRERFHPQEEIVKGLSENDIKEMVRNYLKEIRHEFPTQQVADDFFKKVKKGNPLYILVALEELRVFGKFEALASRIRRLPDHILDLFDQVLERIEGDFNSELVRECLSYIACGWQGMTAEELQELLKFQAPKSEDGKNPVKLPDMLWSRLHRAFSPYLFKRSDVIDFFHNQMKEAVGRRYLDDEKIRRQIHKKIGDYFQDRWPEPYQRAIAELPHQRIKSNDWNALAGILSDFQFIEAKFVSGLMGSLQRDYDESQIHMPDGEDKQTIQAFQQAVSQEQHHLKANPDLTFPQIYNRLQWQAAKRAGVRERLIQEQQRFKGLWLRILNRAQEENALIRTFPGHTFYVRQCAFSPDGKKIVSAGAVFDHTLRIWATETGEELFVLKGHDTFVESCSFSPDGSKIASSSSDKTIKIWDPETGRDLHTMIGHTDGVYQCDFSPDSRTLVSASHDMTLRLWDLETGRTLKTFTGHKDKLLNCKFSPDGNKLLSRTWNDTIKIWDVKTGREKLELRGYSPSWSHDGKIILAAIEEHNVRMVDVASGRVLATLSGFLKNLNTCAWSPNGKWIAAAGDDQIVRIYDSQSGKEIRNLTGHPAEIKWCCWSPAGDQMATAGKDDTIKIWEINSGDELATLKSHYILRKCSWSPDGKRIFSEGSYEYKEWDPEHQIQTGSLKKNRNGIRACSWSPDSTRIAFAVDFDNTLVIVDAGTQKEIFSLKGHQDEIAACSWSPDGRHIVSGSKDRKLIIWDAISGLEKKSLPGHGAEVTCCAWSPDGSRIASGSGRSDLSGKKKSFGEIKIWDVTTGKELSAFRKHQDRPMVCAWSPDGTRIVSAGGFNDRTLKVWQAKTVEEIATFQGQSDPNPSCSWSPDSQRIVSIGAFYEKTISIWDARTGQIVAVLKGHDKRILACSWSPDGKTIASGGEDQTIRIWNAESGETIAKLEGHHHTVTSCCWSPDSKKILSGDSFNILKIWKIGSGEEPVNLTWKTDFQQVCSRSPDGRFVTALTKQDAIIIWDLEKGEMVSELQDPIDTKNHYSSDDIFKWSPDSNRMAATDGKGKVHIWDRKTGDRLSTLGEDSNGLNAWTWSPDGKSMIAQLWRERSLIIWDIESGKIRNKLLWPNHVSRSLSWSPDSKKFVSAGWENSIVLRDAATGKVDQRLQGDFSKIAACAFTADESRIVAIASGGILKIWEVESGRDIATLRGHAKDILYFDISPDGQRIVSASSDDTLKLWDASTGEEIATFRDHKDTVNVCHFSFDGQYVVSGSNDQTLKLWNARIAKESSVPAGHTSVVYDLAWSPDGTRVVTAGGDHTVNIWDTASFRLTALKGHSGEVHKCRFNPDGSHIVTINSSDKSVTLWEAATGNQKATLLKDFFWARHICFSARENKMILAVQIHDTANWIYLHPIIVWQADSGEKLATLEGHSDEINCMALGPDGTRLATASKDKTLMLWDLKNHKKIGILSGHSDSVSHCAFSPDGQRLVSGSDDKTLKLWDLKTGKEIQTMEGHNSRIAQCSFSPDGNFIASHCFSDIPYNKYDNTVKLWDGRHGELLATHTIHSQKINSCAFSPGSEHLLSCGTDGTIAVWNLKTNEIMSLRNSSNWNKVCSWSPDGQNIIYGSSDGWVVLWDLAQNQVARLKGFLGTITIGSFSPDGRMIALGDSTGRVLFLGIENKQASPPLVTPFIKNRQLAFPCPFCNRLNPLANIPANPFARCPQCEKTLQLNPFVTLLD